MLYYLENEYLQVSVDSHGAELDSLREKGSNYEYLWQGDEKYWKGRSPILFPVIGNLNEKKYCFDGKNYTLGIHGFAKDKEFLLTEKAQDRLLFSISSDERTFEVYPFRFQLSVEYRLAGNKLSVGYIVKNIDDGTMYFSIGAHPGFNCPVDSATGRKKGSIFFSRQETANRIMNESGYLTGEEIPFLKDEREINLGDMDFDGTRKVLIFKDLKSEWVTFEGPKRVSVSISGFPYLGIWSSQNAAPFVCIEPWHGVTSTAGDVDELTRKEGILRLEPDGVFTCSYEILCHL